MKVLFLTEGQYTGKIPNNHPNMRSDLSWIHTLNADHYPINYIENIPSSTYDLGICILPKKKKPFLHLNVAEHLNRICSVSSIMQESNYFLWQDNDIEDQIWYLNNLADVDFMFVHNDIDKQYYTGLLNNKHCEKLPTVMVTDYVETSPEKLNAVMLGGNMVSIYRGIDAFMISRYLELPIYALSSGRKPKDEEQLGIIHLPWVNWSHWIKELSKFTYAIQIGTGGAGSFNLNCAYLGIPCVGLNRLETQNKCFPDLSIDEVDLSTGRNLMLKLKNDKDFYQYQSEQGKINYNKHFAPEVFKNKIEKIYKEQLDKKYKK